MRHWLSAGLVVAATTGLLAGCGGGTTSEDVFEVAITDERVETVQGNRCAARGNAANVGNL